MVDRHEIIVQLLPVFFLARSIRSPIVIFDPSVLWKYTTYTTNFAQITGIVLVSIGVALHGVYHQYQHFLDNSFFSVSSLLVAVGSIIFIIAFFGCCGTVRESYCMIITVRFRTLLNISTISFSPMKYTQSALIALSSYK